MIQQSKKGFSLIEVLLLFTVLAMVLAASIPVISKKSNPIPTKVNHGVYRCIATQNGLLEELYTGTRRVSPPNHIVQSCSFRVPKAALYRVDMYSAGAGGTQGALMYADNNDNRQADFKSNGRYDNFEYPAGINLQDKAGTLLRRLSAGEIIDQFKNEYLIRSVLTKSAGSGGNAEIHSFSDPTYAVCWGEQSARTSQERIYNEAKAKYDGDNPTDSELRDLLATKNAAESRKEKAVSDYDVIDDDIKDYNKQSEKVSSVNALISALNAQKLSYPDIKYGCDSTRPHYTSALGSKFSDLNSKLENYLKGLPPQAPRNDATRSGCLKYFPNELNALNAEATNIRNNAQSQMYIINTTWGGNVTQKAAELKTAMDKAIAEYNLALAAYTKRYDYLAGLANEEKKKAIALNNSDLRTQMLRFYKQDETIYDIRDDGEMRNTITWEQLNNYCKERYRGMDLLDKDSYATAPQSGKASLMGATGGKGEYLVIKFPFTFRDSNNVEQYLNNLQNPSSNESFRVAYCSGYSPSGTGQNCVTTSSSANLSGKSKVSTTYDEQRRDTSIYDASEFGSKLLRKLHASKGEDVKVSDKLNFTHPYTAWSVPKYVGGLPVGNRTNVTLLTGYPTGGESGKIDINESGYAIPKGAFTYFTKQDMTMNSNDLANNVFKTKPAYKMTKNTPQKGIDTQWGADYNHQIYDDRSSVAKIYHGASFNAQNPMYYDPYIRIESKLWKKSYKIGASGTKGQSKSEIVQNLGTNCSFTVPRGGRIYDYLSGDDYEELEDALTFRMTCRNKDNQVVFDRELKGGKYNPLLYAPENNTFYWYQGVGTFERGPQQTEQPFWKPTSVWALAFNFMRIGGNYDLNAYRVGYAGEGTRLVDKCIAPKGYYSIHNEVVIKYTSSIEHDASQSTIVKSPIKDPETFDGIKNGQDCYGNDIPGTEYFISGDDNQISAHAQEGGGGAVVITW